LDIQIQALEGQNRARILSSPTLMTVDNQAATVASGQKVPIISVTVVNGAQQASVTFQDVTTRLQVTPRVVGDGRILLTIGVKDEVVASTVNAVTLTAPVVNTRSTITQAEVLDGGTVVIAGIRQESFQGTEQGIPWLSKVPVLGWLFKNDLTDTRRRELTVFLTAKVVPSPGQAAAPAPSLPVAPGTPAPPGPSGEAPTVTIPKTVLTPATPTPPAGNGPQSGLAARPVSEAALIPAPVPAGRSLPPATPSGGR
jgi:type IV pilus assembly protein PilQ